MNIQWYRMHNGTVWSSIVPELIAFSNMSISWPKVQPFHAWTNFCNMWWIKIMIQSAQRNDSNVNSSCHYRFARYAKRRLRMCTGYNVIWSATTSHLTCVSSSALHVRRPSSSNITSRNTYEYILVNKHTILSVAIIFWLSAYILMVLWHIKFCYKNQGEFVQEMNAKIKS